MGSINIDQKGGDLKLTARTKPTSHTIKVKSLPTNPAWITGDLSVTGDWTGTVLKNEDADDRSFELTASAITNPDSSYEGTTFVVSSWTVTQPGTGTTPTPPAQVQLIYSAYASFGATASADLGVLIYSYGAYQATDEISLMNAVPQKDGSMQIMVATDGEPTVLNMTITVNSLTSAVDGMFSMCVKYDDIDTGYKQIFSGYVLPLAPNYVVNKNLEIYVSFTPSN